jgi:hypothetical protein
MIAGSNKHASPRRWLKRLHRIGYVTTALIIAELAAIAFFAARGWLENREMRAARMEVTRTHEGRLRRVDRDTVNGNAVYLFGRLPDLGTLHGDGLRFVAMPSFNQTHFAIAISLPKPDASEAEGVLERFDQRNAYAPLGQRQFRIPATAYRSWMSELDKLTDGWPGEGNWCLDGTPSALERVRGRRITSGIGGCGQHYDAVALLVWNYLSKFAPGDDLPKRGDWEPSRNKG